MAMQLRNMLNGLTHVVGDRVLPDEWIQREKQIARPSESVLRRLKKAPTPMGHWGHYVNRARERWGVSEGGTAPEPAQPLGPAVGGALAAALSEAAAPQPMQGAMQPSTSRKPQGVSPTAKSMKPGGESTMGKSASAPASMMYEPDVRGASPILMGNERMNALERALWRETYIGNPLEQALRRAGRLS